MEVSCSTLTTLTSAAPKSASESEDGSSAFSHILPVPEIPIYAVIAAFREDPSPVKLNLSFGVYRTEDGKPFLPNAVRRAEHLIVNDMSRNKEYIHMNGTEEFTKLSAKLILGADSPAIKEKRVTTVQSLSGSGALRIGAEILAKHYHQYTVYLPSPTYGNHPNFFYAVGLDVKTYRYYDPETHGLDFQGLLEDLEAAPLGSVVLLHACGHNPTGVDPTIQQWEKMRQLIRSKRLLPFFDSAYQGLVSGNVEVDAESVRLFAADGGECLIAQSYSKIMGLYGERVGALSIVCKEAEVAETLAVELKTVILGLYLTPPIHGASIVTAILKDRELYNEWGIDLKVMTDRLISTRQQLVNALSSRGTPGNWSHIKQQVGMYSISGLTEEQVACITREFHIYMPADGRINIAGLGPKTVPLVADAIHAVVTSAI